MSPRALRNVHLVAAAMFVAAVLVLAVQLITPSPIMVSMGDSEAQATRLSQYFTYGDVAVIVVAAVLCGSSGTYLVLHDRAHRLVSRPADSPDSRARPQSDANDAVEASNDGVDSTAATESARRERWAETAERLRNNEETIYELLVDAGGELPQRNLVEETDLSKATVSRTLDKLEHRGLVERRRDGMGNTIHLQ